MDNLTHRAARMTGRDPHENNRAASHLELLFDLAFVVAFGRAADELAHALVSDHVGAGIVAFVFAAFAVAWAWINFSWFASAFDTDDWVYRIMTMVQMVGVLILALGVAPVFESIAAGEHVDNRVMVAGYVVMRAAMVLQWSRAARQDPERREAAMAYVRAIVVAQAGWIVLAVVDTSVGVMLIGAALLVLVELGGPYVAERRHGGTPWHAHHIAERYGLMVIIALGEGMIGTTASMAAVVGPDGPGWSTEVALVGIAGVGVTFGVWWTYFVVPNGELLHHARHRAFGWGYGHIVLFGAVVAIGAGLHAAAYSLEHHSELGVRGTVLALAVPLALYLGCMYAQYAQITRTFDRFHLVLIAISAAVLVLTTLLAGSGLSLAWCLLLLSVVPWVTVVGYEVRGHRHSERVLEQLRSH